MGHGKYLSLNEISCLVFQSATCIREGFSATIPYLKELVIDPLQPRKTMVIHRSANSAKAIKMHWCAFCLFYGMNVLVLFLLASNA
jgi:hypothetical protein